MGHCPQCNDERKSEVLVAYEERWEDEDYPELWGKLFYRVLECAGCEEVYFQREEHYSGNTELRRNKSTGKKETIVVPEIIYWPAPSKRQIPEWYDDVRNKDKNLYSLLGEVYEALDNDLRVLAAIGIRTTFDKASELLGIDPNKSFGQKLSDLQTLHFIGAKEKDTLNILTDAGSAAAHRGWKPTLEQLKTMMDIIENFIYRSFLLSYKAKKLQPKIPARNGVKKKTL